MMGLIAAVPRAPLWTVDYAALEAAFDWVRALRSCPQDRVHHAEGDVGIHTGMVLEALAMMPAFRSLDDDGRLVCFLGCLLHDVAKPHTTREVEGRITAKGHSTRGAILARQILWELGFPFAVREQVCAIVRAHQIPFFLVEKPEKEAERKLLQTAIAVRADWLAIVTEADARGRTCADQQRLLDAIELFRVFAVDVGAFDVPFVFADAHSRFRYFRDERRTRFDTAFDDTRCTVTVMSGLPASGKNRWVTANVDDDDAVISLDALREEHDLEHGGPQRAVVQLATEQLKLRLRAGQDAVWNATSLARDLRGGIVDVADAYKARVRFVCCEAAADVVAARNRAREAPVPARAIARMLERWEMPNLTEGHVVDVVV
ncbi:MAG: AAA family ATPase [Deltaproteobacteria bacterium]|nr:AAA family ATPase [Deltaproteobacteria bacterium]